MDNRPSNETERGGHLVVAFAKSEHVVTGLKGNETVVSYSSLVRERLELARHKSVRIPEGQPRADDPTGLSGQGTGFSDQEGGGTVYDLQPMWFTRPGHAASLSLQPLQEWEGYVISVGPDQFTARLVDVTRGQQIEEEAADFPLADLSDDNLTLLKEGAVFRWVIGYQRSPGGTKRRVSQVTFRRLPAWTKEDMQTAKSKAERLIREIPWE
jgi:hypothetical protein